MTDIGKVWVFDLPHALRLTRARQEWLREVFPALRERLPLVSALDVACGVGHFTGFLRDAGFHVLACDARPEHVAEAQRRYPDVAVRLLDVETDEMAACGKFDLVLCFGLLYHLENPFRAIRNLSAVTRYVLLIESVVLPHKEPVAWLSDEPSSEDQGVRFVSFCPSEPCLVGMCYRAGFPFVYRATVMPNHPDFRASLWSRRARTILVASKQKLKVPFLRLMPDSLVGRAPAWLTPLGRARRAARGALSHVHQILGRSFRLGSTRELPVGTRSGPGSEL